MAKIINQKLTAAAFTNTLISDLKYAVECLELAWDHYRNDENRQARQDVIETGSKLEDVKTGLMELLRGDD